MGKFKKWLKIMKPKFKNYRWWLLLTPVAVVFAMGLITSVIELVLALLYDISKSCNILKMKTPSLIQAVLDWSNKNDKPA